MAYQRRLKKEYEEMTKRAPLGIRLDDGTMEDNIDTWRIHVQGPEGTLYEGEAFILEFKFNSKYPFDSPQVYFTGDHVPVHPHIYSNGHICLSILDKDWSPAMNVMSICLSIQSMLSTCTKKLSRPEIPQQGQKFAVLQQQPTLQFQTTEQQHLQGAALPNPLLQRAYPQRRAEIMVRGHTIKSGRQQVLTRPFRKYQALGNDFILMDGRRGGLPEMAGEPAQQLCDRHFGIGADGLILALLPQQGGDVRMQTFNTNGTEAEMCGNGIRCFARFLADLDRSPSGTSWQVETPAGLIIPKLLNGDQVTVDMGEPFLDPTAVPTSLPAGSPLVDVQLEVAGQQLQVAAVGMGNPHAVVQVEDLGMIDVNQLGPALEQHPVFPARTNVHFVQVHAPDRLQVRVWERGASPTLACGTGACASVVATHLRGACARRVTVELPGGLLQIHWDEANHLQMAGPAIFVFEGQLPSPSATAAVATFSSCIRPDACLGAPVRAQVSLESRSLLQTARNQSIGSTA